MEDNYIFLGQIQCYKHICSHFFHPIACGTKYMIYFQGLPDLFVVRNSKRRKRESMGSALLCNLVQHFCQGLKENHPGQNILWTPIVMGVAIKILDMYRNKYQMCSFKQRLKNCYVICSYKYISFCKNIRKYFVQSWYVYKYVYI